MRLVHVLLLLLAACGCASADSTVSVAIRPGFGLTMSASEAETPTVWDTTGRSIAWSVHRMEDPSTGSVLVTLVSGGL
jgi:hypothetical protein